MKTINDDFNKSESGVYWSKSSECESESDAGESAPSLITANLAPADFNENRDDLYKIECDDYESDACKNVACESEE